MAKWYFRYHISQDMTKHWPGNDGKWSLLRSPTPNSVISWQFPIISCRTKSKHDRKSKVDKKWQKMTGNDGWWTENTFSQESTFRENSRASICTLKVVTPLLIIHFLLPFNNLPHFLLNVRTANNCKRPRFCVCPAGWSTRCVNYVLDHFHRDICIAEESHRTTTVAEGVELFTSLDCHFFGVFSDVEGDMFMVLHNLDITWNVQQTCTLKLHSVTQTVHPGLTFSTIIGFIVIHRDLTSLIESP